MKLFRIVHHQRRAYPEDLLLNSREHSNIQEGDIVEIYHRDENSEDDERNQRKCRLLLQVAFAKEPLRDFISVESSIALAFNLKNYGDVCMKKVDPAKVALDSIEFTFKDQYLGRSEMWRLKKHLTNTCVYVNKIIEYCGSIRCQVYEMWSQGEKVACGVIDKNTRIVYRSGTSMVYLFLQMSSEMWDFDIHGDLYFEKAVNGFLTELFAKWKKQGSNHEVTIVLFSRTFYEAKSLDEFPVDMRECLQLDYRGRFYEDFYRVAIQNERNDDWSTILVQLRQIFTAYKDFVLKYHEKPGLKLPKAYNSSAAQGNFLEVLNISLNVFEKHYLDRSFDRTGQLSVVLTPGVGVFEVDRELTNITKQRIIDNGVASDLVCVGEQPLHAVPLLRFHYKDVKLRTVDDYCFPHWINLSFYSSDKKVAYSTFIPRIKLPPFIETLKTHNDNSQNVLEKDISYYDDSNTEYIHNSLFDYDAYDEKVFGSNMGSIFRRTKKSSVPSLDIKIETPPKSRHQRKMSDPNVHHIRSSGADRVEDNNSDTNNTLSKIKNMFETVTPLERALINPFDPTHITVKLTSNRRRWSHIFPKTKTGNLVQIHHYQIPATHHHPTINNFHLEESSNGEDYNHARFSHSVDNGKKLSSTPNEKGSYFKMNSRPVTKIDLPVQKSLLWGPTGEQEWSAQIKTGVDWKSLVIPSCLPITTDYFPDRRSLNNDYVLSDYSLLPDDVNEEFMKHRAVPRKPLDHLQVFNELVSQRLAQGFQLIILPEETKVTDPSYDSGYRNTSLLNSSLIDLPKTKLLSIGRIFHKISLAGSEIKVTRYRPRHPYSPINVEYRYRFHAPQHDNYEVSGVIFTTEKLENFNWNLMDQYICTRGDFDFMLHEPMKYWRYRMYLLPKDNRCTKSQVDDFVKFVESHINKLKKIRSSKGSPTVHSAHYVKRRHSTSNSQIHSGVNSHSQNLHSPLKEPFRERVGSNRYPEKQRPRSGSKIETKSQLMALQASLVAKNSTRESEDNDDCFLQEPAKFTTTSTIEEIFEAFKNPSTGVGFLEPMPSLPSFSFTSYEAFQWLSNRMESNLKAWDILKEMKTKRMICHASGDFSFPIKPGYYLYYIVDQNKESSDYRRPLGDLEAFVFEWLEVEIPEKYIFSNNSIQSPVKSPTSETYFPSFLKEDVDRRNIDGTLYKQAHLEIDSSGKSDRVEWAHARYNRRYIPNTAFEITVQWITASGPIVQDHVKGWDRKAQSCGFQLIPIPADPLAEPFIEKSDPLRSPIFIPLNIKSLLQSGKSHIFEDFPIETWEDRMLMLQDEIVRKFGFITRLCETKTGSNDICVDWHYVHISGNIFVLVPSTPHATRVLMRKFGKTALNNSSLSESLGSQKRLKNYYNSENSQPSKENQYITRHVMNKTNYANELNDSMPSNIHSEAGFLWQWNHAIANRKWKSFNVPGSDELHQHMLLRDFKEFCSNSDGRLVKFWEDAWEKIEQQSLANNN